MSSPPLGGLLIGEVLKPLKLILVVLGVVLVVLGVVLVAPSKQGPLKQRPHYRVIDKRKNVQRTANNDQIQKTLNKDTNNSSSRTTTRTTT